jgi:hypothetical protein
MKYLILFFGFIFYSYSYCQTQVPDLIIPIKTTFQYGSAPINMEIGLDSTATNCLDPHLGESELPPIPPPGWVAVISLPYPECQNSLGAPILVHKDFRFGELPYTGTETHRLGFRADLGATIHWDLPNGVTGLLQDVLTGGGLINYPIAGQDSFYVPYNFINEVNMLIYYSGTPEPPVQVLSHITITDGQILIPRKLYFGLDPTATDSIDTHLGESALPPFPPPGAFEARYILPENNFSGTLSSYSDFRFAELPFTGQIEWRLAYQPGVGDTITIIWDFPTYLTGTLLDIFNGTLINVSMADSGSFTVNDPFLFNQLKMLIDFDNALPVELNFFTASAGVDRVTLNWSTAAELNNYGFEIQRSEEVSNAPGNRNWHTIGFVNGFGTTTENKNYTFTDRNPLNGISYYRLKQVDFDGTFRLYDEVRVEVNTVTEYALEQNYPNPFNPSTVIEFSLPEDVSNVKLSIYNALGEKVAKLVNSSLTAGKYQYQWNAQNFATGMYIYELRADKFVAIRKMLLIK